MSEIIVEGNLGCYGADMTRLTRRFHSQNAARVAQSIDDLMQT